LVLIGASILSLLCWQHLLSFQCKLASDWWLVLIALFGLAVSLKVMHVCSNIGHDNHFSGPEHDSKHTHKA